MKNNIVKINEHTLRQIIAESVKHVLREHAEQEVRDRIFASLSHAYDIDYIDDSSSFREIMALKFDILKYAFHDDEIYKIPKDVLKSAFAEWYETYIG